MTPQNIFASRFGSAPQPQQVQQTQLMQPLMPHPGMMPAPGMLPQRTALPPMYGQPGAPMGIPRPAAPYQMPTYQAPPMQAAPTFGTAPAPAPGQAPPQQMLNALRQRMGY